MRSLETGDVFAAARLLIKIGVRDEIQNVAKRAEESKEKKVKFDMGFDLLFSILEKAINENGEQEIYKFIASLFECEPGEVRKMNPLELCKKLEQVANIEEWKSFFGYVKRLIMKK